MSRISTERRLWRCPGCDRSFRIPAGAETPRLCPECVEGEATVALAAAPLAAARKLDPVGPAGGGSPTPVAAASPETRLPVDEASIAVSLRQISEHLAGINRSMRFIRRIAWGVLISSILTVLIYGYLAWLAMDMLRPLGGSGGANLQELLEPVQGLQQEYQRALDEALK